MISPIVFDFFFCFPYIITGKTDPVPWWPCFSTDQIYFSKLGRGSSKDLLCQIIFKSSQRFLTLSFMFSLYIQSKTDSVPKRPGCHVFNGPFFLKKSTQKFFYKKSCHGNQKSAWFRNLLNTFQKGVLNADG